MDGTYQYHASSISAEDGGGGNIVGKYLIAQSSSAATPHLAFYLPNTLEAIRTVQSP